MGSSTRPLDTPWPGKCYLDARGGSAVACPVLFKHGPTLIILFSMVVYLPVLTFDFAWDDRLLVVANWATASPTELLRGLGQPLWGTTPIGPGVQGYYRPVLLVDLAVDRWLFGLNPGAHHLHSLLWHLVSVALTFKWLEGLLGRAGALLGASVFAVHPIMVESVVFVSARNDTMVTALVAGTLLALQRQRWGIAAVTTLAAVLTKEVALVLPVVAGIGALLHRGPLLKHIVGPTIAVGAGLSLRWGLGISLGSGEPVALTNLPAALAIAAGKIVWPVSLTSVTHLDHPGRIPWFALAVVGCLVLVACVRDLRRGALATLLGGVLLAPSMVAILGTGFVSDRYFTAPMLALALVIGLVAQNPPGWAWGLAWLIAPLTVHQTQVWQSNLVLWDHHVNSAPSPYAHGGFAKVLEQHGDLDGAAHQYHLATQPPDPLPHACFNITAIHLKRGDPETGVQEGQRALQAGCPPVPELMAPLALATALTGDLAGAERLAQDIGPDPTGQAVVVRIAAAVARGDLEPFFEAAPTPEAQQALGPQVAMVLQQAGETDAAEAITPR